MRLAQSVRQIMMARGYTELLTYSFLQEDFPRRLLLPDDDVRADTVCIANPISKEQSAMRTMILPGLLKGLSVTLASGFRNQVKTFEQGNVFINGSEVEHLGALLFNGRDNRSPHNDRDEGFFDLKADVATLFMSRGIRPVFKQGNQPFLHSGQSAFILVDDKSVGWMGRLKPALEHELDVEGVYVCEIDLSDFLTQHKPHFVPASQFPAAFRDISMLVQVDRNNLDVVNDIRQAVIKAGCDILALENLRLFDIYQGNGIPQGFRSLAYALSYRSHSRTLTDEEVDKVHNNVREILAQNGYVIR